MRSLEFKPLSQFNSLCGPLREIHSLARQPEKNRKDRKADDRSLGSDFDDPAYFEPPDHIGYNCILVVPVRGIQRSVKLTEGNVTGLTRPGGRIPSTPLFFLNTCERSQSLSLFYCDRIGPEILEFGDFFERLTLP